MIEYWNILRFHSLKFHNSAYNGIYWNFDIPTYWKKCIGKHTGIYWKLKEENADHPVEPASYNDVGTIPYPLFTSQISKSYWLFFFFI